MPHKTENQQALSHEQYFLEHRYLDSYRFAFKNHCFKKKKSIFWRTTFLRDHLQISQLMLSEFRRINPS